MGNHASVQRTAPHLSRRSFHPAVLKRLCRRGQRTLGCSVRRRRAGTSSSGAYFLFLIRPPSTTAAASRPLLFLSSVLFVRSGRPSVCASMGRAPCCDRAAVKRGPWSPEEDDALRDYMQRHGSTGSWITLPSRAGLRRCGKSCRLRWLNYLRPDIRHGGFTDEEDAVIYSLYSQLGSKWSLIASQLERRTDNDVKNHWNTKLKKRLAVAAAPFSSRSDSTLLLPSPAPATTAHQSSSSLLPLAAPTVKAEAYAYDGDFLAPAGALQDPFLAAAEGSTSASLSAASSGSNWSTVDNGPAADGGFFADFCTAAGSASDLAAADQFLSGFYYPLDPSLSLV